MPNRYLYRDHPDEPAQVVEVTNGDGGPVARFVHADEEDEGVSCPVTELTGRLDPMRTQAAQFGGARVPFRRR